MKLANWRKISSAMDKTNLILEIIDARDPWTTRSRKLEDIARRKGKKLLLIINKADLVPRQILDQWIDIFKREGIKATYISARKRLGTLKLRKIIKREAPQLPAEVFITGFPKVGKSSIINVLKGHSSASTSSVPGNPGYTKHFQLYKIDRSLYLLDSPGIIPAEGGPLEMALHGYPPEDLRDSIGVAVALLQRAILSNPKLVKKVYGIDEKDPIKILERLALRRDWKFKDGEPNLSEAARQIIRDYHRYKLVFYVTPKDLGLSGS